MTDDCSNMTISREAGAAIVDAVQRAIIDKGASQATRKAAFSALLALIEAGLITGNTPTTSAPVERNVPATALRIAR
jgi:hypothetical protein